MNTKQNINIEYSTKYRLNIEQNISVVSVCLLYAPSVGTAGPTRLKCFEVLELLACQKQNKNVKQKFKKCTKCCT